MIESNNLLFFYTAIRDNMHNPAVCLHGIALAELPSLYCHSLRSRGSLSKRVQQCHMHNSHWRSEEGAGRTGPHLLGAANGRKLFLKIHVKIQTV